MLPVPYAEVHVPSERAFLLLVALKEFKHAKLHNITAVDFLFSSIEPSDPP